MATIPTLQIPTMGAVSGGADFSPLAQLPQLYAKYQQDQANKQALAQFQQTGDPKALIGSGDMNLAQLGISAQTHMDTLKQQAIQNKMAEENLGFNRAAANRVQSDWEEKAANEAAAKKSIEALLFPGATAPRTGAAPAAPGPSPFPAPLPTGTPQVAAPGAQPGGEDGSALPAWASPQSLVGRITGNLTSGQPAATAGINREQIAELYRNPETRNLATAFLQKQMDPGTWSYHFDDKAGRVLATNTRTNEVKDVTPSGAGATSQQQQEYQGYFKAGKDLNMTDDQARAFAANKGKMPKEDLNPTEMKLVEEKTKAIHSGEDVMDNLNRLKELSKTAWSGAGASTAATVAGAVLPGGWIPKGATDTTELQNVAIQNVARQAKETFGSRLAVAEVKLLNEIETNPLQSNEARQRIYTRLESMFKRHMDDMTTEREQIRNKTFFKPGGSAPGAADSGVSDPLGLR